MIFKQVEEILSGKKTQTRRIAKPGEGYFTWRNEGDPSNSLVTNTSGTVKWEVGRTYAIVPGRGKPAVWWHDVGGLRYYEEPVYSGEYDLKAYYMQNHWQPLRICITAIRQEPLQSITEADARAEGVNNIEEYRALWERINGKTKGARWEDNPTVWMITFELVRNP